MEWFALKGVVSVFLFMLLYLLSVIPLFSFDISWKSEQVALKGVLFCVPFIVTLVVFCPLSHCSLLMFHGKVNRLL